MCPLGQAGVGFAYRDGAPAIWLDFPYREEPLRYDGSETPAPPDVQTHRWRRASAWTLDVRRERRRLACARCAPRRRRSSTRGVGVASRRRPTLAAYGLYRWHYKPDPARLIETAAFDRDAFGARATATTCTSRG